MWNMLLDTMLYAAACLPVPRPTPTDALRKVSELRSAQQMSNAVRQQHPGCLHDE